jgi:hypothetical protein
MHLKMSDMEFYVLKCIEYIYFLTNINKKKKKVNSNYKLILYSLNVYLKLLHWIIH